MRRPGEVNRPKLGAVAPPLDPLPVRGGDGCCFFAGGGIGTGRAPGVLWSWYFVGSGDDAVLNERATHPAFLRYDDKTSGGFGAIGHAVVG